MAASDELTHYGTPHVGATPHSGRYKYGSGERANQHSTDFLAEVSRLHEKGLTEAQIAKSMNLTTTQLRARKSIAKAQERAAMVHRIEQMREKGMSATAIGKELGINESSVRSYLSPTAKARQEAAFKTAKALKEEADKHSYIDIGRGVENHMGVSADKLKTSVEMLKEEGYKVMYVKTEQLGTGNNTSVKVLVKPGVEYPELAANAAKIRVPGQSTEDGIHFDPIPKPLGLSSKRVSVRWAEDGGTDRDGVIEIRPGVSDVALGKSSYAQVRVLVDGTHYLKGMAMYSDDLPAGVDIRVNSNKSKSANKHDAFKPIKDDPDNPFGATTKPHFYTDAKGKRKQSVMNFVNEEGTWDNWSKNLPSQFLSKQRPSFAKEQLDKTTKKRMDRFDEIMSLTNPVVKKKLLMEFAESCDSAAVHLKAAALPRQATHVILPAPFMKDTEIYAPKYKNGEKVALVRFPHGGTFEIPELTVNNRNPKARKLFGELRDAVGIHPRVAERLSGADFDGDSVLVLPNNSGKVKSSPALKGLEGFDPKATYKLPPDAPRMSSRKKGQEMGSVSNLITDMTIQGASASELARAVRHSMVVIDAEKHHLDYKQSEIDHGIKQLKKKYQGGANAGAATLISRSSSQVHIPDRKARPAAQGGGIDPKTGKKVYVPTGEIRYSPKKKDANGNVIEWTEKPKTIKSKKMAETDDAHALSSGTKIEGIYADYANGMKALGNRARKEALATPNLEYSPSARKAYAEQHASLKAKLNTAKKGAPLERRAQLVANAEVRLKLDANPDMDSEHIKKLKAQAINKARISTGASKYRVSFTPLEWEAIQNGAISGTMLKDLLANADIDQVTQLAMPKTKPTLSAAKKSRARAMLANGATTAEVAEALGISTSTLNTVLNG